MSILASLTKAYERIPDAAAFGYSSEKIGFVISLHVDGTVASITDLRQGEGKKKTPRMMQVPASFKRPGVTPRPFFLWDNTAFVLGISAAEAKDCSARHKAFHDYHLHHLTELSDAGARALCAFLHSWNPDQYAALNWPADLKDQNVVFALESERRQDLYLHDRPALRALWADLLSSGQGSDAVCLITGKTSSLARLHPAIKGVWGAQSSGASIVSFNLDAFTGCERAHLRGGGIQVYNRP